MRAVFIVSMAESRATDVHKCWCRLQSMWRHRQQKPGCRFVQILYQAPYQSHIYTHLVHLTHFINRNRSKMQIIVHVRCRYTATGPITQAKLMFEVCWFIAGFYGDRVGARGDDRAVGCVLCLWQTCSRVNGMIKCVKPEWNCLSDAVRSSM